MTAVANIEKALATVASLTADLEGVLQQEHDLKDGAERLVMEKVRILDLAHQSMVVIYGKADARSELGNWAGERGLRNADQYLNVAHVVRELEKIPAAKKLNFRTLREIGTADLSPQEYHTLKKEMVQHPDRFTSAGYVRRWAYDQRNKHSGQWDRPHTCNGERPTSGGFSGNPPGPEPQQAAQQAAQPEATVVRKTMSQTGDIHARLAAGMRGASLLGLAYANPPDVVEIVCKHYLRVFHPDRGGVHEDFVKINEAVKEVRSK